jgi:hypothetical protein
MLGLKTNVVEASVSVRDTRGLKPLALLRVARGERHKLFVAGRCTADA